jgi:BCD family chlorophyll transporter-like MFS transporter
MPTPVVWPPSSGGGLLTLFKTLNPDHVFGSYGSVFGLQIAGFLVAAVLMHRLDVDAFRRICDLD